MKTELASLSSRRKEYSESNGLLFFGSITPHDRASGALITTMQVLPEAAKKAKVGLMFFDIPEAIVIAQAWSIYDVLIKSLKERAVPVTNVVRQRIFVRDIREIPAVERVMDIVLGGWRPTTTFVLMPNDSIHADLHVQMDAVVAVDGKSLKIFSGESCRYPTAIQTGRLLFTSAISGTSKPCHELSTSMMEEDKRLLRTEREVAIYEQGLSIFSNLKRTLELAGARFSDILKVNGWASYPMREYGAAVLARRRFFDQTKENMMASTGLAVGATPDPGSLMSFDAIVLLRGAGKDGKEVTGLASPIASPYVAGAVKGAGLIFTSGEIPVIVPQGDVVTSCDLLPDEGRLLRFGHIEPESGMESRAWYVYRTLEGYLEKFGAKSEHVVHQTVFIKDARLFPVLERIATLFFGKHLPPTTVIPIFDTTPFPSAELEIEVIAALD